MPPKKTIIVDPDQLLTAIGDIIMAAIAETQRAIAAHGERHTAKSGMDYLDWSARKQDLEHDQEAAAWAPCDLRRFAGHDLTPSERIRHQQAIRQLEADGLVIRDRREIGITRAGWKRYDGLKRKRPAARRGRKT